MRVLLIGVVLASFTLVARADDPVSGPKVGEKVAGFEVDLLVGTKAGEKLDPLKEFKDKPVLLVFIGTMTRPGFGLLKNVDKYGQLRQPEGLEVLIVRLSDNREDTAKNAKYLHEKLEIKSLAGISTDGKSGPKNYTLNEECEMTILLLDKDHKVLHNLARRAPERQDFDDIRKAIDKLLGPSPVPFP